MIAEIVVVNDLLMTVAASVVAGLGVTVVVSMGIWGATRYVDLIQEDRAMAAYGALTVGGLGLLMTILIIVAGLYIMVAG